MDHKTFSKKGGKSKSDAKKASARRNMEIARRKRWPKPAIADVRHVNPVKPKV